MLSVLALALAAVHAVSGNGPPAVLHGQCFYPPRIAKALPNATRVICDTVEVNAGGVDFVQREWDAHSRFLGRWQGGVLTVTALQPRNGRQKEARGSCRIDRLDGRISMVSCAVVAGGRDWLANFRAAQ
jgi:hypothetical protein